MARVGRGNAPYGTTGAVFVSTTSNTFQMSYTTPATLTLGTTKQISIRYNAPLLTVYIAGVECTPSVDLSISPYSISGPLNIGIGSDINGMTASYSNIFLVNPTETINPGNYVPSQFATVQAFTSSALFYQSSLSANASFGVVTTEGLTNGFYNLPGSLGNFALSRLPVNLGNLLVASMEFQATSTSAGENKDFFIHLSPTAGNRISLGTGFSSLIMYANGTAVATFTTSPSTFTNLYKFELKLVNKTTLTGTIYNVANGYSVIESKTATITAADDTKLWAGNLEIRNQAGSGSFIIGNIIL